MSIAPVDTITPVEAIGPILRLVTPPLTRTTLGLFSTAVNAVLYLIAAGLTDAIEIKEFVAPCSLQWFLLSLRPFSTPSSANPIGRRSNHHLRESLARQPIGDQERLPG